MIDAGDHLAQAALHCTRKALALIRWIGRAMLIRGAHRALREFPEDLLKKMGLNRSDILAVANTLASEQRRQPAVLLFRPARERPVRTQPAARGTA